MFFKKDEKQQEVQQQDAKVETAKVKIKVVYRTEDKTGQGEWTITRVEVPREQELGANEFPKILAAQKAVYEDLSLRMKKLKEVRARVKAIRKSAVEGGTAA